MRKRVLVVDEYLGHLMGAIPFLNGMGLEVLIAYDGVEAVDVAGRELPDLILLETSLKKLSGFQVCEFIKDSPATSRIPVIFVTATSKRTADKVLGFRVGATDYITLPYEIDEFEVRIERVLMTKAREDKLFDRASFDALTGVMGRAYLLERLNQERDRAIAEKLPMSCLMLDLDMFKVINDNHGHAVGDEALKHVVEIIRTCTRKHDLVGRLGGEEFFVVLPNCPHTTGVAIAKRIRKTIATTPLISNGVTIPLTVSVGVSFFTSKCLPEYLLMMSDVAMYEAKKRGRNRVVYWDGKSHHDAHA